jgi:hypothetical protein
MAQAESADNSGWRCFYKATRLADWGRGDQALPVYRSRTTDGVRLTVARTDQTPRSNTTTPPTILDAPMKLPNWFKILWWALLTSGVSWLLYKRYPDLTAGHAAPVDIVFFVIWIALMLVPLFQEVSLLGLKFKQEVEGLKSFVAAQISDIRNEVKNAVDVTVSPQITIPPPTPDAKLPALEERIKAVVADALAAYGAKAHTPARKRTLKSSISESTRYAPPWRRWQRYPPRQGSLASPLDRIGPFPMMALTESATVSQASRDAVPLSMRGRLRHQPSLTRVVSR